MRIKDHKDSKLTEFQQQVYNSYTAMFIVYSCTSHTPCGRALQRSGLEHIAYDVTA